MEPAPLASARVRQEGKKISLLLRIVGAMIAQHLSLQSFRQPLSTLGMHVLGKQIGACEMVRWFKFHGRD